MLVSFVAAFSASFMAVLEIFLVVLVAGLLVRLQVITQAHISGLSRATVTVFLPCLIFSNVVENLDPGRLPFWWAIPLAAVAMPVVGLSLGALLFVRELPERLDMLPLASMQNAGYLVLPVGLRLFAEQFDTFALYCFLFILGFNPVLWSLGKLLTCGRANQSSWRALVTPPLVANAAAIAAVLTGASTLLPQTVGNGIALLGQAAVPVATFILGAVLGSIALRPRAYLGAAIKALTIKLMVLPALTITAVLATGMLVGNPLLARFFVIEAAAAPAAGIILLVRSYGGDEERIGSVMLIGYCLCTVTLPLWVALCDILTSLTLPGG